VDAVFQVIHALFQICCSAVLAARGQAQQGRSGYETNPAPNTTSEADTSEPSLDLYAHDDKAYSRYLITSSRGIHNYFAPLSSLPLETVCPAVVSEMTENDGGPVA
jgi:hypothetical protein